MFILKEAPLFTVFHSVLFIISPDLSSCTIGEKKTYFYLRFKTMFYLNELTVYIDEKTCTSVQQGIDTDTI